MGLILDTNLLIDAERLGLTVRQAVEHWSVTTQDRELGISVISLAELGHGIARADGPRRRAVRIQFVSALRNLIPIYQVDEETALRAGMIDGDLRAKGFTIGMMDALVAATALERGDGVATQNLRHFKAVPGLEVVEL
jgi:predicted nucleic acid-binding protein